MSFTRLIVLATALVVHLGSGSLVAQTPVSGGLVRCSIGTIISTPAVGVLASDGSRIFVGSIDGTLTAFDSKSLEILWRAELGGEFGSNVIVSDSGLFVVTKQTSKAGTAADNATLRMVSREAGVTGWVLSLPNSEQFFLGKINGAIAAVSKEGTVTLAERVSGQLRWQAGPFGKVSAKPSFSSESLLIASSDKQVLIISGKDGSVQAKYVTDFIPTSVTYLKDQGFAAGDERGNVFLFGPNDSKSVWRFKSGAGVSSVGGTADGILVASLDNFVYFISDYNGDVIWKRRLTGRVGDAGLTVDGRLIVLVNGENSVFVVDLQKGRVTDTITPSNWELISREAVFVRDKVFVVTTMNSLETYSVGGCLTK